MTQPIEPTQINPLQVVNPTSRYANATMVYYGEQRILTFETYQRRPYVRKGNEAIAVITKGVEYRPDLASYDYYGHVDNWWRILEVNHMKDIWEFKAGTTIILPDVSQLG